MTDHFFNNIFKYHQSLYDPEFARRIQSKIDRRNQKRNAVLIIFSILGTLASIVSMMFVFPSLNVHQSTNWMTTIAVTFMSLFIIWLIFEETEFSG